MKTTALLLLCFIFTANFCSGQNLVPNPSFEEEACPTDISQLDSATGWITIRNTPDYFNVCATASSPLSSNCKIPQNDLGYQNTTAYGCVGYVGLITHSWVSPNGREIFGCALSSDLVLAQKYFVSFKVSLAEDAFDGGTNNIGVLFKMSQVVEPEFQPNSNKAHVKSTTVITDTSAWTSVFGSFVADSAYGFLQIGNFFDDSLTLLANPSSITYYFIDDVCVSTDSAFCKNYTYTCVSSITDNVNSYPSVYPNPASDYLHVSSSQKIAQVFIYNSLGQQVYSSTNVYEKEIIKVDGFTKGVYILKCRFSYGECLTQKIIIN